MVNDRPDRGLLSNLFEILEAHRSALNQTRTFWRAVGMVLGDLMNFGRHTVTQELLALGITDGERSQIFAKLLLHHRFVIVPVAEVHLGSGGAFKDNEVGANAIAY